MNSQEAKFILHAYRHNGGDASDPQFKEALEQLQRDTELAAWFAEEKAFSATFSKKLKSVPVPPDLKSNILAGSNIIKASIPWYRRTWLAAAACFVILAGLSALLFMPRHGQDFALFRNDMANFLSTRLNRLDMDSSDMTKIRQFLDEHGGESDLDVPEKLAALRSLGCRIVDWNGEKVTLVCFHIQGGQEVHLMVADRSKFRNPPSGRQPQFEKADNWMTASWSRGDKVYLLAGVGDQSALQRYF